MDQTFEMRCTCPPTRWEKGDAAHDPGCPLGDSIAGKVSLQPKAESEIDEIAPELLAKLFHENYERLAPSLRYTTRKATAKPWEKLSRRNRALMIGTCRAVLAELERRAMTEPMSMLVSKLSDGQIRVDFSKKIKRFEIKRAAAVNFAITILNQCGVQLEIKTTLPPAPGEPV